MATRVGYVGTESTGDVLTKANFDKLPGGLVGYTSITSDTGGLTSTSTIPGLNPTIVAGTGRFYVCTIGCSYVTQTGALGGSTATNIEIWDLTAVVKKAAHSLVTTGSAYGIGAGDYPGGVMTMPPHQPSAGSQQYGFRTFCGATSVVVHATATAPAFIQIFDVGPAF